MYRYLLSIFCVLVLFACNQEEVPKTAEEVRMQDSMELAIENHRLDSIKEIENTKIFEDRFEQINYNRVVLENATDVANFIYEFTKDTAAKNLKLKNKIIRTLNRKEFRYYRVGDTVIIPDKYHDSILAYSVFPQYYHGALEIPKIIMISNVFQAYACYEHGVLTRFAAANTGKERTQTYPGRYYLEWKQWLRKSSLDSTWILPFTFNFHRWAGNAFHQFEMPGRPVSHSCVRQFHDDAEWLFKWGKQAKYVDGKPIPQSGTPVIIIDHFDFTRKKYGKWIDITSNKDGIITLPENPLEVEEALIPISQIPKISRGSLRNRSRYMYAEDSLRARGIIREGVTVIPTQDFNKLRREKKARLAREAQAKAKADSSGSN